MNKSLMKQHNLFYKNDKKGQLCFKLFIIVLIDINQKLKLFPEIPLILFFVFITCLFIKKLFIITLAKFKKSSQINLSDKI